MINNYEGCTPIYDKPCDAVPVSVPTPSAPPIAQMLGTANDLTLKALDMALHISSQVLGRPSPEMKGNEPCCLRDVMDKHVDDLKKLCEELSSIIQGLGV